MFHIKILQSGAALIAMSSFAYPDADTVSYAIGHVHGIVGSWDLDGRWITAHVAGGDIVTNEEIHEVSTALLSLNCL